MAHVVRGHSFTTIMVNEHGCLTADTEHEAEATELRAELFLPFEAALRLATRGASNAAVAGRTA